MLAVAEINYIRHEVNIKDSNYSEIAQRIGRDRRTVKKYAEQDDFSPVENIKQDRPSPVMDPIKHIVDEWLIEDFKQKRKFRRTAKRIWEQLKEEFDFKGSDRTVRNYISHRKKELLNEANQAALSLESKPGSAQVDFGEAPFKYQGEQITLPYLVLSYPYSNSFYFQVFPAQNKECFLEGLKRIFHHMGGVPRTIRFDNLSAAVKKVLPNGERQLTEEFQNFVLHYGFESEFCNPNSGNEKGHVEAMVKYVRNNYLLPGLHVLNLDELNKTLWEKAEKDRERKHYEKESFISQLFEEDRKAFLVLPSKEYQCIRYETVKADKYGYIKVEKNLYSTSPRYALNKVLIRISYNSIDILTDDYQLVVSHPRLYGQYRKSINWQPYLNLMAKRPMALKYTSFYEQLPQEWQTYFNSCTSSEKSEALKLLGTVMKDYDFSKITEALKIASEHGHPSVESIKQVFYQLINGRGIREEVHLQKSLPIMPEATRGLQHYNQLLKGAEIN
ncbi:MULTISPECIES: IS21 family transposase [Niallia]|uniref:IS21 family transposase n=1 Tax=Niallia TaxID=2837506 RepID=UPI000FC20C9A|nr:IS21 family transposase [Niallia circulans]ECD6517316.1 IS21 family transposase [Salmonella enterica subsp. enterica serovar Paratyphi A]NRG28650.1 IS21 family transposase [Niallia circulans]QJX61230.1 IS21 family transposase [Niallia circulans]QJX61303.1 IS21 family transposase [Niallia circulans]QJX61762.1 IS21 family transposase [Niallia circulans]